MAWNVFASLIPFISKNVEDMRKNLACSVLVESESESRLCYCLGLKKVNAVSVGKAGENRFKVYFFNDVDKKAFILGGDFKDAGGRLGYKIVEELFYYVINIPPVAVMDDLSRWFSIYFKEEEVVSVEPITINGFYTQRIKVVLKKKITGRIQLGAHDCFVGCGYDRYSANGRIYPRSTPSYANSYANSLLSKYPTNTTYANVTAGVTPTYATTYTKPVEGTIVPDQVMETETEKGKEKEQDTDKQIADALSQVGREEKWGDVPDTQQVRGDDQVMGENEEKLNDEIEEVDSSSVDTEEDRRDFPTLDQLTKRQKRNKKETVKEKVKKAKAARELKKLGK